MRARWTIEVDVDQAEVEKFVERNPEQYPLTAKVDEWYWRDLDAAIERGLAEEPDVVDFEIVPE